MSISDTTLLLTIWFQVLVICTILTITGVYGVLTDDDQNNAVNVPVVVGPDGLEIALPTPAPTLSPWIRRCQGECGDQYFKCAVMKCENLTLNETDFKNNLTESFDGTKKEMEQNSSEINESRTMEKDNLQCWVHCRESFQECMDKCKHICDDNECTTKPNELIPTLPSVRENLQHENTERNSSPTTSVTIIKGNKWKINILGVFYIWAAAWENQQSA